MPATPKTDVIAFIQPFVPNYRVGLFDAIAAELEAVGLRLEVWHDEPRGIVAARGNSSGGGPWSVRIKQRRITVKRRNVTFRGIHRDARRVRAVVAGLASTNLETYLLAADPSVALLLWGHGRNFTASNNALDARLERWLLSRAKHVFTYTEQGAAHLAEGGTPREEITVVRNSTDAKSLRRWKAEGEASSNDLREALDLTAGWTGLFAGALDAPKRLPFLFTAMDIVAAAEPRFRLLIAGAGPLDTYVRDEVAKRPWATLLGRLEPKQLAAHSTVADVMLMPGRVGLVAVDSLALGVPVATTRYPFHAPEADYLTEVNSLWTADDERSYADGLLGLLNSPDRLASLGNAALTDGMSLSSEASGRAFARGICQALGMPSPAPTTL